MKPKYQHKDIEPRWIEKWQEEKTYVTADLSSKKEKKYVLVMFPYPSGAGLHTGHVRVYTGTDVLARYYRMKGYATLHPMGWDAFGLPAENAAIKQKINPKKLVPQHIENFKRQMNMMGLSYDWDRELSTTDPKYYAITQWLFIEFFKHGLLYKKDTPVYYCESCKTGLAQEEVMGDGTHERCGNPVTKKNLPQWIFRITSYADRLIESLEGLDWPRGILEMQKNWVGRKEGIHITYPVDGLENQEITCFTTRADTNYGATFIVLAPEHPFAQAIASGKVEPGSEASQKDIKDYVSGAVRKTERERMAEEKTKTGVFTGHYAVNRLNGRKLPIWISDFVLASVGTGAVVGVPAHDKRDYEFAASFDIDVVRVVEGPKNDRSTVDNSELVFEDYGVAYNSPEIDGLSSEEALEKISDIIEENGWGSREVSYHLRDWIFSRQRYWGEPIPMVHCKACEKNKISYWNSDMVDSDLRLENGPQKNGFQGLVSDIESSMYGWFPISVDDLPLELPDVESYEPGLDGKSPLADLNDWTKTTCPSCGGDARRETDTMPNWAGSCWYFLQFAQDKLHEVSGDFPMSKDQLDTWLPVDWYIGGAEHAVLHLLYARFWMHALHDMGHISFKEPFRALRNVGMVIAEDNRKMSKSIGNVINPDDVVEEFGADATRVYEMFMAPFSQEIAWSTQTLQGAHRFLKRIWQIYNDPAKTAKNDDGEDKKLASELQSVIKKISRDIPDVKFNTPISSMMEFLNMWEEEGRTLSLGRAKDLLKLLAPFAPFVTEHIWRDVLGEKESIHLSSWPEADESLVQIQDIIIPVQVNGKVRDQIKVSPSAVDQESVVSKALESDKINRWIEKSDYDVIYVQGKILNLVTK